MHRARLSCVCLSWIEINSRTRADWWDVYQAAWITNEQLGVRQPCLNIRQILAKTSSEWSWTPLPSLLTYYPHWLDWRRPDNFRSSYDMASRDKGDHTSQGPKILRFVKVWNDRENLIPKTAKPWRPKIGSTVWSVVWLCTFVSYLGQHGPAAWLPSPFLIAQCSICFPIWSAWLYTMPWLANYTFLIIDINERVTKEAIQPPLVHQNTNSRQFIAKVPI